MNVERDDLVLYVKIEYILAMGQKPFIVVMNFNKLGYLNHLGGID